MGRKLLLGLIHRTHMYGYQIHQFIERNLAACTDLKKPPAYFLLDKLVKQGLLTRIEERKSQRPPRQIYQITPGEAAFNSCCAAMGAALDAVRAAE